LNTPLEPGEHMTQEVLEDYCFERLPPPARDVVKQHLSSCNDCVAMLLDVDEDIYQLRIALEHSQAEVTAPTRMPMARAWRNFRETAKKSGLGFATTWAATAFAGVMAVAWIVNSWNSAPPGSAVEVHLVATRGGDTDTLTRAPAKRLLHFDIDTSEIPPSTGYRIEIVNARGKPVWSGPVKPSGQELVAEPTNTLRAGVYWVRLYGDHNDLVREYGLKLEFSMH
jgi:hypothetical protein